jgi:hypothetical protein
MAPMNNRLLRPIANNIDPDAAVYLNAVAQEDGQPLEPAVRKAINDFIVGCKADGIWSAIGASCVLAGARTLAGALTPLKGGSPTNFNNNFVSGDYDRKTGLKGNGSNKSLNTNRAGNADGGQNDRHAAVYVSEATSASGAVFRVYLSSTAGSSDHVFFRQGSASADLQSRFHSSSGDSISGAGAATGLIGSSRSNSADYIFRHSGGNNTITRASAPPIASGNYLVFTNNTAAAANHNDGRLAFYSIGTAIDLALLETRVSALITALGTAI